MLLTNIFEDISQDFDKLQYQNAKVLSRRFVFQNGCAILVNLHKESKLGEVGYLLPDSYNITELKEMPKWKGMEQRISTIAENGNSKQYLFFSQLQGYEPRIFLILMQDIIDIIDECEDFSKLVLSMRLVLNKWNSFFQDKKELVLSENKQQGLYGELYVLEKLIALKGNGALKCWTGFNAEAHDFYIKSNALEVKSSSAKGPDNISISSEYQLDDSGLLGRLFLIYLKLKKSTQDGETLPVIVERIVSRLGITDKTDLIDKLFKVGYIYQFPELYNFHFVLRDESCYEVKEGFPRIIPKTLSKGIGCVDYVVSLDACSQYQIAIESFYKEVK
ncbi:PD-(D/E)XK motif protein [Petroclostridium sp. X23]|uniref:PD-(D/E)XK motif protein n=1 Tax=Petroclostridium sp. X23 TaxID=3045146 RepID=UPI0024ACFB97|nr:PD-(D/E)XK motif protein [Petroclostridium sp. X23]WHH57176.1 PD-(D/E)XK motif protein [Petroclostridium sp. X23]